MFSCHSGIKVIPISRFEDRRLPAPGPVTKNVSEMMKKIMAGNDDRFTDWFEKLYSL
jgi:branched-subunit amino acid aminotransferase/4-amino-4-deoxychorismate lyase